MATVTKPMALDESFNTTENTSRNVADVLAEGLDNIAESILPKAATEIPIESGSSTNTKDYIDSKISGVESQISGLVKMKSFTATTDAYGNVKIPDLNGNNSIILSISSAGARYATGLTADSGYWYFKVISNTANVTSVVNTSLNFYVWYIAIT